MQQIMALESSVLQFAEAAVKAVATVEIIERSPAALSIAILRAAGDAPCILFASPHDLPMCTVQRIRGGSTSGRRSNS